MIVLDASVLIAHLETSDAHHVRATELLDENAAEPLGASPLTLAEVLVQPARVHRMAQAVAALHQLQVVALPFAESSHERLAVLRAETGLRLPDCCVILAAELAGADIATFDTRLAAAASDLGHHVIG